MKVINFGEKACEKVRGYFDSYLDNELLVETNHEVLRHLASCESCTQALEARTRVKQSLKRAVEREEAPGILLDSVRRTIRESGRRRFFAHPFIAAAAALALVVSGILAVRTSHLFVPGATSGSEALQALSSEAQQIIQVGLIDHVHCALQLGKWKELISFDQMRQDTGKGALGPEFIGLVPLVKEKLGPDFQIVQGHRCRENHRDYVHLILTGQNGSILSLVITEKKGESFSRADLVAATQASGIPVYGYSQDRLEIAGFETSQFLAYVVSNLDWAGNLKVASTIAPSVSDYLRRLKG